MSAPRLHASTPRMLAGVDDEAVAPWVADDVLLPVQLLGDRDWTPEERLWLHILTVALRDGDQPWFASRSEEPQAFRWICAVLHLEPEPVLRCLASRRRLRLQVRPGSLPGVGTRTRRSA